MEQQIKTYLFVLSLIYSLRFVFELIMKLRDENPEKMEISKTDKIILYFTSAYIITYFLI